MIKIIKNFFREILKNDIGSYDPKAEKIGFKGTLYLIIGLILSFIIPCIMVYIETWQFDWNVFKFIWGEETKILYKEGLYRGIYFLGGICANGFFVVMGFYTTYRINGNGFRLGLKQDCRFLWAICFVLEIVCFIVSLVLY